MESSVGSSVLKETGSIIVLRDFRFSWKEELGQKVQFLGPMEGGCNPSDI